MKATFKEIQDLVKRAKEMGVVFDDEAAAAADDFGDTLDSLTATVHAGKIGPADPDRFVTCADLHRRLGDLSWIHRLGKYDTGELRDYVERFGARADRDKLDRLFFAYRQSVDFGFASFGVAVLVWIARAKFGDNFGEVAKATYADLQNGRARAIAGFEIDGLADNFAFEVCKLHRMLGNAFDEARDGFDLACCLGQIFAYVAFLADSVGVDLFFGIDAILRLDFGK